MDRYFVWLLQPIATQSLTAKLLHSASNQIQKTLELDIRISLLTRFKSSQICNVVCVMAVTVSSVSTVNVVITVVRPASVIVVVQVTNVETVR